MQAGPRVKCAKCGKSYYYPLSSSINGGAIRLGSTRYMRCRKCGRFSLFNTGDFSAYPAERGVYNLTYGIVACIIGALLFAASPASGLILIPSFIFFLAGVLFIARSIALINNVYNNNPMTSEEEST